MRWLRAKHVLNEWTVRQEAVAAVAIEAVHKRPSDTPVSRVVFDDDENARVRAHVHQCGEYLG